MDLDLAGKHALVTGGSRGIGKQVALQLAKEGVDVAIAARGSDGLQSAAREIEAESGRAVHWGAMDTGDPVSIQSGVGRLSEVLGGIDILVNAAARPGGQEAWPAWNEVSDERFFEEMRVKVLGYLRTAECVAPHMMAKRWGRIVNVSGLAARRSGTWLLSVRSISVSALSKNLADELTPFGITVNTVHPGATRTEATSDEQAARATGNLLGRMVEAAEVADVVTFLCSPRSVAITGDTITAGGGVPRVIYY